ncbi:MAG: GatB/YqeY domain-containing protein, partial [Bdellovibrionales bacterium]|nr:GatB/YqeY domain-containing protein [Bdellovibrionales bacterium]
QVQAVVQKQIKQVRESLECYKAADQKDKVAEEEYKLSLLQTFLPKPLSEKEIEEYVEKAIAELQPQSMKDMGKIMQWIKVQTKGAVEGKILSEKVKNRLINL